MDSSFQFQFGYFFFSENGPYGFVLPPEQILPNALEIFDGIKAIVDECRTLNYL